MTSSQKKSLFLGMPHGTAASRLRKMVLHEVLTRHGENRCYRCGEAIESVDELSVEHKQPWEGKSVDLFWDLTNIAFSHIGCNRPHHQTAHRQIIDAKLWCPKCQPSLPLDQFGLLVNSTTGYAHACKVCHRNRHAQMDQSRCRGCGAKRGEKKFQRGRRQCVECYQALQSFKQAITIL